MPDEGAGVCVAFEAMTFHRDYAILRRLAEVCVAETDGRPMTGCDIAFMLDLTPARTRTSALISSSTTARGDRYRYDLTLSLTASKVTRIKNLNDQIERRQCFRSG